MEVRVDAHFLFETLDAGKRSLREADVDLARELQPDPACVLPGRAGAETLTLEHDDVAHAGTREVVRDGRADDPAADDDDVGRVTHDGRW